MLNIIISLLTFILIIISLFMVLVILMQRASANAGMGSAFGGGVTESAFGAETTNILTRATKWSAIAFFVISLTLYLLYMSREGTGSQSIETEIPVIPVVSEESPAEAAGSTVVDPLTTAAQSEETSTEVETLVDEATTVPEAVATEESVPAP